MTAEIVEVTTNCITIENSSVMEVQNVNYNRNRNDSRLERL
jgi:hypothetical protein